MFDSSATSPGISPVRLLNPGNNYFLIVLNRGSIHSDVGFELIVTLLCPTGAY